MRKLLFVSAAAAALLVPACGAQTQSPTIDDQAAASQNVLASDQSRSSSRSGDDSRNGGTVIEANDRNDDSRNRVDDSSNRRDDDSNGDDSRNRGGDDSGAEASLRSGARLPADFPVPVPDDYRVQAVGTAGDETAAVLRVPSGEDAYNYYRQALADRGFRVVDEGRNQGGLFEADLEFSNGVFKGGMEFDGDTVKVETERNG